MSLVQAASGYACGRDPGSGSPDLASGEALAHSASKEQSFPGAMLGGTLGQWDGNRQGSLGSLMSIHAVSRQAGPGRAGPQCFLHTGPRLRGWEGAGPGGDLPECLRGPGAPSTWFLEGQARVACACEVLRAAGVCLHATCWPGQWTWNPEVGGVDRKLGPSQAPTQLAAGCAFSGRTTSSPAWNLQTQA